MKQNRFIQFIKKIPLSFWLSLFGTLAIFLLLFFFVFNRMISRIFYTRGADYLASGNYVQSIEEINTALFFYDKDESYYISLCDAYIGIKSYDLALETAQKGIEKQPGATELYICKARTYVYMGQIIKSATFLDKIENQYVQREVSALRPGALEYTPTQGSYDKSLKVSFTEKSGETIYYTTDGSEPSLHSTVYKSAIQVGKGTTKITAFSINEKMLVSPKTTLTYVIDNPNEAVSFADATVEGMVRAALSKPSGPIYARELDEVTALTDHMTETPITTLEDLALLPELSTLALTNQTKIEDFSPLANKSKLTTLTLTNCNLSNTDFEYISNLSALEMLDVSYNRISSLLPLENLTFLSYLDVSNNNISSLEGIQNLKELTFLCAAHNRIEDLSPLSSLSKLEQLDIGYNAFTTLALPSLPAIRSLSVAGNAIKQLGALTAYSTLKELDISACSVYDLEPLQKITTLEVLRAGNNSIGITKYLETLPLIELHLENNLLSDTESISKIASLQIVTLSANPELSDISTLSSLPQLTLLFINDCPGITSVGALASSQTLETVYCKNCFADDLSLLQAQNISIVQ